MRPPDKDACSVKSREHAKLLLRKAAQDEYLLDAMLPDPLAPEEAFGFHAQQAVEKLLKALLTAKHVTYPHTHRIGDLITLANDNGMSIPSPLDALRSLTPFAVEFRYGALPDEPEEPLDRDALRRDIDGLRVWVQSLIQET